MGKKEETEGKEAIAANDAGLIELGEFAVKSVDDGGAEIRLSDEKHGSNMVARMKSLGKSLEVGQVGRLTFTITGGPPLPPTVIAEIPADETAGLTPHAKILKDGKDEK